MSSAILPAFLAIPRPTNRSFSSLRVLTPPDQLQFRHRPLSIDLAGPPRRCPCPPVRMGGGPRTYPGGVSKWQWKRMQAKKAKQLLQARLLRERQIYEMRKRAELKAAVSELERPWEVVERAPALFSRSADEQVRALADRFQRAGGFDMWSERDGPQVFRSPDGLPSARFFPKGVVHSVKPYGIIKGSDGSADGPEDGEELRFDDWIARGGGGTRRRSRRVSDRAAADVEANDSIEGSDHQFSKDTHWGTQNARVSRNSSREDLSGAEGRRVSRGNHTVVDIDVKDSMEGSDHQFSRDTHLGNRNARLSRNSSREDLSGAEGRRISRGSPSNRTVVDIDVKDSMERSDHQFSRDTHLGNQNARLSRNSSREDLSGAEGRRNSRGSPSNSTMVDIDAKDSIEGSNHRFSRDTHLGNRNARLLRNSSHDDLSGTEGRRASRGSPSNRTVVDINTKCLIEGGNQRFSRDAHFGTRNARFSRNSSHEEPNGTEGRRVSRGSLSGHSYKGRGGNVESYGRSRGRYGNGRRQGLEGGGFGFDSDVIANGREESRTMVGRGGHGSRNSQFKAGKISLRPSTDLYTEEGDGSGTRGSDWSRGGGFRTNQGRR